MARTLSLLWLSTACVLLTTVPHARAEEAAEPANATSPSETADSAGLETIVVTAEKRQENMQKVPISVTALSGDQLATREIHTTADLVSVVPSLETNGTLGRSVLIFSLRGVGMRDFSFNQDGPVATYYDEVYKGNFPLMGVYLYDLERVEVLKGPQGTLYGMSTTGGAINLISRKPDFTTGGNLSVGYGNYDHYQTDGAVQTAFNDKFAVRVAFMADRSEGFIKDVTPGAPAVDSTQEVGVRTTLRYKPDSDLDVIVRGYYSRRDPYYDAGIPIAIGPKGIGNGIYEVFGGHSDFRTNVGRDETADPDPARDPQTSYGASVTVNDNLSSSLSLTSITSWDDGRLFAPTNPTGSALKVVEVNPFGHTTQVTQDLRLTSAYEAPFNFILGGYFNREYARVQTLNQFYADIDVNGDDVLNYLDCAASLQRKLAPVACAQHNQYTQTIESAALYGDVSYNLTDRLKFRIGMRFTHDKGSLDNFLAQLTGEDGVPVVNTIPGGTNLQATSSLGFTTNKPSGMAGVDFAITTDVMLYGNYSEGYRRAAFNGAAYSAGQLNVARPELVHALELGFKSEFFDHILLLNGAGFWYRYENQQGLDSGTGLIQQLIGLPKTRIIGGEFEAAVRPVRSLTISGNVTLLDAKIQEGTINHVDVSGNPLIQAPAVSLSGAIDWTLPISAIGAADFHVDSNYTGSQHFDLLNSAATTEGGYSLLNSSIRFHSADDSKAVTIWIKNATDKYYFTQIGDFRSLLGVLYGRVAPPRTYGVSASVKF
jgi:iron complex outermembrane recepter protein